MVVRGRTMKPLLLKLDGIERKNWLKLLGMAFQDDPLAVGITSRHFAIEGC
jgi:hypothetical protein